MKVASDKQEFRPVHVILESSEERRNLLFLLRHGQGGCLMGSKEYNFANDLIAQLMNNLREGNV